HVIDQRGIERIARFERAQRLGRELERSHLVQRPVRLAAAPRRAHVVVDKGVGHWEVSCRPEWAAGGESVGWALYVCVPCAASNPHLLQPTWSLISCSNGPSMIDYFSHPPSRAGNPYPCQHPFE